MPARTLAILVCLLAAHAAHADDHAEPDLGPTLGTLIARAESIAVYRLDQPDPATRRFRLSLTSALKGTPEKSLTHRFDKAGAASAWAGRGRHAVCFGAGGETLVCWGGGWYRADKEGGVKTASPRFVGRAEDLERHVRTILAGREAVITVPDPSAARIPSIYPRQAIPSYDDRQATPEETGRDPVRGRFGPVWRVRASLKHITPPDRATPLTRDFVGRGADPAEIPALRLLLSHDDARERATAANALGTMGPEARAAVPALRRALNDPDMHASLYAADALLRIDPDDRDAASAFRRILSGKGGPRLDALAAAAELGEAGRTLVPSLLSVLRSNADIPARVAAAEALGRIRPPGVGLADEDTPIAAALLRASEERNEALCGASLRSLLRVVRPSPRVLRRLGAALRRGASPEASVAERHLSDASIDIMPALLAAFEGERPCENAWALQLASQLGHRARVLAPALIPLLRHKDPKVAGLAATILASAAAGVADAGADATLAALTDRKTDDGELAWSFPDWLPPRAPLPRTVAALVEKVRQGKVDIVARHLAALGPQARACIPLLKPLLGPRDLRVGIPAAYALADLGESKAVVDYALRELPEDYAAGLLMRLGPAGRRATPDMLRLLKDGDEDGRWQAAEILLKIGTPVRVGPRTLEPRRAAIAYFERLAREGSLAAAVRLAKVGPEARSAVPALLRCLREAAPDDQWMILRTLGSVGPDAHQAEPALRTHIRSRNPYTRVWAAGALLRIRPGDHASQDALREFADAVPRPAHFALDSLRPDHSCARSVPWLAGLLRHPEDAVARHAGKLLWKIDPATARRLGAW